MYYYYYYCSYVSGFLPDERSNGFLTEFFRVLYLDVKEGQCRLGGLRRLG